MSTTIEQQTRTGMPLESPRHVAVQRDISVGERVMADEREVGDLESANSHPAMAVWLKVAFIYMFLGTPTLFEHGKLLNTNVNITFSMQVMNLA